MYDKLAQGLTHTRILKKVINKLNTTYSVKLQNYFYQWKMKSLVKTKEILKARYNG